MGTVEWIALASVGVLAGLGLGFFLGRLGGKGNSQKLADVEAELEDYRKEVSEHFSRSAEHFQAIGRQYRELYEHMAAGSEKLCVGATSDTQLRFPRPDEVTAEQADDTTSGKDEVNAGEDSSGREDTAAHVEEKAQATGEDSTDTATDSDGRDRADKPAESVEAATAPVDYADDDPKDRRYH